MLKLKFWKESLSWEYEMVKYVRSFRFWIQLNWSHDVTICTSFIAAMAPYLDGWDSVNYLLFKLRLVLVRTDCRISSHSKEIETEICFNQYCFEYTFNPDMLMRNYGSQSMDFILFDYELMKVLRTL